MADKKTSFEAPFVNVKYNLEYIKNALETFVTLDFDGDFLKGEGTDKKVVEITKAMDTLPKNLSEKQLESVLEHLKPINIILFKHGEMFTRDEELAEIFRKLDDMSDKLTTKYPDLSKSIAEELSKGKHRSKPK